MLTKKSGAFDLLLLFSIAGLTVWTSVFYDMYQFPKALAVLLTVFFSLFFIMFKNQPDKTGLNIIFPAAYCLYSAFWILFTSNHPPFYYYVVFFSPVLFFTAFYSKIKNRTFADFINIFFLAALVYGLYQFFIEKIIRPYSFFGNPIFFAEFIGFCLPFAVYSLAAGGKFNVLGFACVLLSIPAIITASSRGPAISAVISISMLIFYYARAKVLNRLKIPVIAALTAVLLLSFLSNGFISSLTSNTKRISGLFSVHNPEIQNRLNLAASSFEIFKDSPVFGSGPGAIKKYQQLKQSVLLKNRPDYKFVSSSYSHNDYVQLLAETGITGLLLYLLFLFSLAAAFEKTSPLMDTDTLLFSVALFSSIIFIVVESFFNFPLFSFPSSALLFIAAGLAARESMIFNNDRPVIPGFIPKVFALIMIIIVLCFSFIIKPGALASNFYLKEALKQDFSGNTQSYLLYEKSAALEKDSFPTISHYAQFLSLSGNYKQALDQYSKLLILFPYSTDVMYNIGSIYLTQFAYKDALLKFDEALFYYPDFALAHLAEYKILMRLKQEDKAQKHLEQAILSDKNVLDKAYSGNVILFKEASR